jgi:RNA polymerase sigma-70 factor, ECF subfamily
MSEMIDDDLELVRRALTGDVESQEKIYRRVESVAYPLVKKLMGNTADAGDVVQEASIEFFRSLRSFRGGCRVKTFLYCIAARAAIRKLRANRRRRDAERAFASEAAASEVRVPSVDFTLDLDKLANAIAELDDDQRVALVLLELYEFNSSEAAEITGVAPDTLRARKKSAIRELTERLYDRPSR